MRRLILSFGLIGALVVLPATAAGAAAGGTNVPFNGSGKGRLIVTDTGTFIIRGRANVTHLGRVKVRSKGSFTGENTYAFTTTFVAANGDKLKTSSTGESTDTTFINHDTVTGGKGRFVGATGQSITTGTSKPRASDPTVIRIKFVFTGTISY